MPDFQALLADHGTLIIALAVLLDQLGIPIPSAPTLLFAGSMVASGERLDVQGRRRRWSDSQRDEE